MAGNTGFKFKFDWVNFLAGFFIGAVFVRLIAGGW